VTNAKIEGGWCEKTRKQGVCVLSAAFLRCFQAFQRLPLRVHVNQGTIQASSVGLLASTSTYLIFFENHADSCACGQARLSCIILTGELWFAFTDLSCGFLPHQTHLLSVFTTVASVLLSAIVAPSCVFVASRAFLFQTSRAPHLAVFYNCFKI